MTAPQPEELLVLLEARIAGRVVRDDSGLALAYDHAYAFDPDAVPLSLSLPVDHGRHRGPAVSGWMSGILPGPADVRALWAERHGAASSEPFDLLATPVGLDCPGAVQFCREESLHGAARRGRIDWMPAEEMGRTVADMVAQAALWGRHVAGSDFSLAGAHAKIGLYRDEAQPTVWGRAVGGWPTSHILKPSMPQMPDQSINEHLCMATARHLGLPAALTELQTWGGHTVLVVRRFDRARGPDSSLRRIHQEDFHQAMGDYGASIYQGDGDGHNPRAFARMLRAHCSDPDDDVRGFFDALAFNWLIANTDAHAKNYTLMLEPGSVRLAPLYDLWSILPVSGDFARAHSLAMSALDDRRILAADDPEAWSVTAAALGMPPPEGPERVVRLMDGLEAALGRAIDEVDVEHRSSPVVAALSDGLRERVAALSGAFSPTPRASRRPNRS